MKQILLSLLAGLAISVGLPALALLVLHEGDSGAIVPTLLFWPLNVTDRLGISADCANANSVSEKLTCMRTALFIDALLYPSSICVCAYFVYRIFFRRTARFADVTRSET